MWTRKSRWKLAENGDGGLGGKQDQNPKLKHKRKLDSYEKNLQIGSTRRHDQQLKLEKRCNLG